MQLRARKHKLIDLFARMQKYQVAMLQLQNEDASVRELSADTPLISDENMDVSVVLPRK